MTEHTEFNEIYQKYKNLVLKAAYAYSGNHDVAEDITQNTFLQLYIHYHEMNHNNVKSWLYTTAKHFALNHNKRAHWEIAGQDMMEDGLTANVIDSAERMFLEKEDNYNRADLHGRIFEALIQRNSRWYEAIMLVYHLEVPQAKVAEEMGIRIEVLHSLLHRAKTWIKKNFGVEYDELGHL